MSRKRLRGLSQRSRSPPAPLTPAPRRIAPSTAAYSSTRGRASLRRGERSLGASHFDRQPPTHCPRRRWAVHPPRDITNVRCVPEFSDFTLLSVDQMWEEQRIKSSFSDEKQLLLPKCSGGHTIPYDLAAGRNTQHPQVRKRGATLTATRASFPNPSRPSHTLPAQRSDSATSSPSRTLPGSPEPRWGSSCTAVGTAP